MHVIARDGLPPFSQPETDELDWKREVDPTDQFELAKDIAAMANRRGGVIIVGVKEGSGSVEAARFPLPRQAAVKVALAYEQAANSLLSPPPKVAVSPIELDTDGSNKWVVAVNVSATRSIFCAVRTSAERLTRKNLETWLIPKRVGSQTQYVDAAEAQLATVEKLRSATRRTLRLIEAAQDEVEQQRVVRRFEVRRVRLFVAYCLPLLEERSAGLEAATSSLSSAAPMGKSLCESMTRR